LGSGLIIHALANEQDVRRMGGLMKKMPFAFVAMLVGVLAICGVPGLSGFFSKDAVIFGAIEHRHPWLYAVGVITAGITAYYMLRLLFVTFLGNYRGDVDPSELGMRHPELVGTSSSSTEHGQEPADDHHAPQWIMSLPVGILIVPSIIAGWLLFGGANSPWSKFFATEFPPGPQYGGHAIVPAISEGGTSLIVLLVVLAGAAVAWWRYATPAAQTDAVARLRSESVRMPKALTELFWFDAAYDLVFVRVSQLFGTLFGRAFDPHVIDGSVRETVFLARYFGVLVQSLQTGLVRAYALILVFGAACFIVYYAFAAGGLR
jgi:NADH-quinone oxidoreductase subunit L